MDFESKLINALIELFPEVTWIFGYREHSEPADPFCLVSQLNLVATSQAEITSCFPKGEQAYEIIQQPFTSSFNLSFYSQSNSPLQKISTRFQAGLQSNKFNFAFSGQNLSIIGLTKMVFTEESINGTTMLKRGTIQLKLSSTYVDKWLIDAIDEVPIVGNDKLTEEVIFDKTYLTEEMKWQNKK